MGTTPYEEDRERKLETLPMGWADGRTVPGLPEPPAFGTVLPAPGVEMPGGRRTRGAVIGLGIGLLIGGLALGVAVWALGGERTGETP
ncbi:MAG: hypothetical protein IAG13_11790, partial [Deltaproteobacteria bacterium]|nr:hypothetical protein [Nannocystaceae bacterium]